MKKGSKQLKTGNIVFGIKGKKLVCRVTIHLVTYPLAHGTYCNEKFVFEKGVYPDRRVFAAHPTRHIDVEFIIKTAALERLWFYRHREGTDNTPTKKTQEHHWFDQLMDEVKTQTDYKPTDSLTFLRIRLNRIHILMHEANEKDLAR